MREFVFGEGYIENPNLIHMGGNEIPKFLYHGTFMINKDSILEDGIIPSYESIWPESDSGFVYLATSESDAKRWPKYAWEEQLESVEYLDKKSAKSIVFKIDTSKLDKSKFSVDPITRNDYRYKGEIPPGAIIKTIEDKSGLIVNPSKNYRTYNEVYMLTIEEAKQELKRIEKEIEQGNNSEENINLRNKIIEMLRLEHAYNPVGVNENPKKPVFYRSLIINEINEGNKCQNIKKMHPRETIAEVIEMGKPVLEDEHGNILSKVQKTISFSKTIGGAIIGSLQYFLYRQRGISIFEEPPIHEWSIEKLKNIGDDIAFNKYKMCIYITTETPDIIIKSKKHDFEILKEVRYTRPINVKKILELNLVNDIGEERIAELALAYYENIHNINIPVLKALEDDFNSDFNVLKNPKKIYSGDWKIGDIALIPTLIKGKVEYVEQPVRSIVWDGDYWIVHTDSGGWPTHTIKKKNPQGECNICGDYKPLKSIIIEGAHHNICQDCYDDLKEENPPHLKCEKCQGDQFAIRENKFVCPKCWSDEQKLAYESLLKNPKKVIIKQFIPTNELNNHQLIERIKALHPHSVPQNLYGIFVKERMLRPDISAKEFNEIFKIVGPNMHMKITEKEFTPNYYDTITSQDMMIWKDDEINIYRGMWENGMTGTIFDMDSGRYISKNPKRRKYSEWNFIFYCNVCKTDFYSSGSYEDVEKIAERHKSETGHDYKIKREINNPHEFCPFCKLDLDYEDGIGVCSECGWRTNNINNPQVYTSEKTSINQIPGIFHRIKWVNGEINLDIGGGKYNTSTDYLIKNFGVINYVYDPYNRSEEHNQKVLNFMQISPPDTITIANVLNVIQEEDIRREVLEIAKKYIKSQGKIYIGVYEGNGSGKGKETTKGWQNNRKLRDYLSEVKKVFPTAMIKNNMIVI